MGRDYYIISVGDKNVKNGRNIKFYSEGIIGAKWEKENDVNVDKKLKQFSKIKIGSIIFSRNIHEIERCGVVVRGYQMKKTNGYDKHSLGVVWFKKMPCQTATYAENSIGTHSWLLKPGKKNLAGYKKAFGLD